MHQSLTSLLLANATLTSLIGDRLTWKVMQPTAELPRVVLHTISSVSDYKMSSATGLVTTRIQVDCLGKTYASAQSVSSAVMACLSGYRGISGTTTFEGIFHENTRDAFEEDDTPSELFGVSLDFTIWHKET